MQTPDPRPALAIAHVLLPTHCMPESATFFRSVGLRPIFEGPVVSVFELRGGTHLILQLQAEAPAGPASFDLMVDDIQSCHRQFTGLGLAPTAIEAMPAINHEAFRVQEPAGHVITVYSSHASGQPV